MGAAARKQSAPVCSHPTPGTMWQRDWMVRSVLQQPKAGNGEGGVFTVVRKDQCTAVLKVTSPGGGQVYDELQAGACGSLFPILVEPVARDQKRSYVVMEQFACALSDQQLLDTDEARLITLYVSEVLARIVLALEHLHQLGYVHNDIAPNNVGIRRDGSAALLDFGSSVPLSYQFTLQDLEYPSRWHYASLAHHDNRSQRVHPVHDLESIVYVWLHQTLGLPWGHLPDKMSHGCAAEGEMAGLKRRLRIPPSATEANFSLRSKIANTLRMLDAMNTTAPPSAADYTDMAKILKHVGTAVSYS